MENKDHVYHNLNNWMMLINIYLQNVIGEYQSKENFDIIPFLLYNLISFFNEKRANQYIKGHRKSLKY